MTSRLAPTLAAAALASALLGGCGGDPEPAAEPSPTPSTASSPDPTQPADPADPTDAASDLPDGPPILRAALTAQQAVPGATVVSLEDEDDIRGWEVESVRADGRTVTMVVAPGGGRVTLGPTDADADSEVAGLVGQAPVDVATALRSAVQTAPEGVIGSVQLEDEGGAPIWQVDLVDAGGVRVDAVSGEATPDD